MTKVVWTEPAVSDLQSIVDYVARDSDVYASSVGERIVMAIDTLADHPRRGRAVPEARDAAIREIIVGPYRVMYRVSTALVEVLAIVHGARSVKRIRRKPWKR